MVPNGREEKLSDVKPNKADINKVSFPRHRRQKITENKNIKFGLNQLNRDESVGSNQIPINQKRNVNITGRILVHTVGK